MESLKSLPNNDYYTDKDRSNSMKGEEGADTSKLVMIRDTQKLVEEDASIQGTTFSSGGKDLDAGSVGSTESLMAFQLDQVAICPPDKEQILVRGE